MATPLIHTQADLLAAPRTWLITGVAGFIGSNLLEALLLLGQRVVGLDNFSTGCQLNLDDVRSSVSAEAWARFHFLEGDLRSVSDCQAACAGADVVLHQAALGSVPRSLKDPLSTHQSNVDGFVNILLAARDARAHRFVYASSSSVYGDHPGLPKVEDQLGQPLSPYALTKAVDEQYARIFARSYGVEVVGLRYFNVFGRRQSPNGPYAAVIPRWIDTIAQGRACTLHGDGQTSRDFCFIDNVVQANLLAATCSDPAALDQAYNVACGERTTLLELHALLASRVERARPGVAPLPPVHTPFRDGDVRHSLADISKARRVLGYAPTHTVSQGLDLAVPWYLTRPSGQ